MRRYAAARNCPLRGTGVSHSGIRQKYLYTGTKVLMLMPVSVSKISKIMERKLTIKNHYAIIPYKEFSGGQI
jgi:hypothetical protein